MWLIHVNSLNSYGFAKHLFYYDNYFHTEQIGPEHKYKKRKNEDKKY